MKHLSTQDCIDFVRRMMGSAQESGVRRHLDLPCSKCRQSIDSWSQIMEFASRERRFIPPEPSVRAVINSFTACRTEALPDARLDIANSVFDSFRQRPAFGIRSTASPAGRQLLYRCGTICIDVRMQTTPGSNGVLLIGQLVDSSKPNHLMAQIPVSLLSSGMVIGRKKTNDLGEFDFGFDQLVHGQLLFRFAGEHKLMVPVPDQ